MAWPSTTTSCHSKFAFSYILCVKTDHVMATVKEKGNVNVLGKWCKTFLHTLYLLCNYGPFSASAFLINLVLLINCVYFDNKLIWNLSKLAYLHIPTRLTILFASRLWLWYEYILSVSTTIVPLNIQSIGKRRLYTWYGNNLKMSQGCTYFVNIQVRKKQNCLNWGSAVGHNLMRSGVQILRRFATQFTRKDFSSQGLWDWWSCG